MICLVSLYIVLVFWVWFIQFYWFLKCKTKIKRTNFFKKNLLIGFFVLICLVLLCLRTSGLLLVSSSFLGSRPLCYLLLVFVPPLSSGSPGASACGRWRPGVTTYEQGFSGACCFLSLSLSLSLSVYLSLSLYLRSHGFSFSSFFRSPPGFFQFFYLFLLFSVPPVHGLSLAFYKARECHAVASK